MLDLWSRAELLIRSFCATRATREVKNAQQEGERAQPSTCRVITLKPTATHVSSSQRDDRLIDHGYTQQGGQIARTLPKRSALTLCKNIKGDVLAFKGHERRSTRMCRSTQKRVYQTLIYSRPNPNGAPHIPYHTRLRRGLRVRPYFDTRTSLAVWFARTSVILMPEMFT